MSLNGSSGNNPWFGFLPMAVLSLPVVALVVASLVAVAPVTLCADAHSRPPPSARHPYDNHAPATVIVRLQHPSNGRDVPEAEPLGGPFFRLPAAALGGLYRKPSTTPVWAHPEARRRVVLDALGGRAATDEDPLEALQWHLGYAPAQQDFWPQVATDGGAHVRAEAAWTLTEGDPTVVVAVLDTGLPAEHPEFPPEQRVAGWDFVDNDDDPSPATTGDTVANAHGTVVAGLISAARNGVGVVGVCPRCSILPIRLIASDQTVRDGDLVAAVMFAADRAHVLNASWSFEPSSYVSPAVHDAIRWATNHGRGGAGSLFVTSAGNSATQIRAYVPEAMVETLTVGATDETGLRASYSNTGAYVSLVAPGGENGGVASLAASSEGPDRQATPTAGSRAKMVTADLAGDDGYNPVFDSQHAPGIVETLDASGTYSAAFWGTSAAAPVAAGAAALVWSVAPLLTPVQVAWVLTDTAVKAGHGTYDAEGRHPDYGHGRLNVGAAVQMAHVGTSVCEPSAEACGNGIDDDCDRTVDEDDPDCGAQRPRPFVLPLGETCDGSEVCGDGYCHVAVGLNEVRTCTADCEYDCPAGGLCLGRPGRAQCYLGCENDVDCRVGTLCVAAAAGLRTPSQQSANTKSCMATCHADSQCPVGITCNGGACSGALALSTSQDVNADPATGTGSSGGGDSGGGAQLGGCALGLRLFWPAVAIAFLALLGLLRRRR